jgi:hypothetical protein
MRTRGGLTLIEVLLGVLLLSLIGALAYSLVLGARRVFERQSDWAERVKPASEVMDSLVLDLAGSVIPEEAVGPPYFKLVETGGGSELTLTTAAPPLDAAAPLSQFRVMRVTWRVEVDAAGRSGLVREARPERAAGETPAERFRLEGVHDLAIQVYDGGRKKWIPEWTTGRGGVLPSAARVKLKVETSRGMETISQDAVIPAGLVAGPGR